MRSRKASSPQALKTLVELYLVRAFCRRLEFSVVTGIDTDAGCEAAAQGGGRQEDLEANKTNLF